MVRPVLAVILEGEMHRHHVVVLMWMFSLVAAGCGTVTASPITSASAVATATVRPSEAAVSAGPAATATRSLDPNYSGYETIAFGTGGSECTLAQMARTFKPDDPIRVAVEYTPSLPAGTVVTIRLFLAGAEVEGYPVTVTFDIATSCVFGNVSPGTLPPGTYRLEVAPDTAPAVSGEFETAD
jgi:hypothetical protein